MTPRSLTVKAGLARWQVRQHLQLSGYVFTEEQTVRESVFTVEATDVQWREINEYAEKVRV